MTIGTSIAQRIKLNDPGQGNGEFQVWVNGASVMDISGLIFRNDSTSLVRGIQLQTFMGGESRFNNLDPQPTSLLSIK
jgi:hypothetical protein